MERQTIPVGTFEVNCSIVKIADKVLIIDPGAEGEIILKRLEGLTPTAILLTHAHFDHIGAINALQTKFPELPVYITNKDAEILTHPMNQYPPDYPAITKPTNLRDANALMDIKVVNTPGHTPGGVCYYFEQDKILFSGDTLFRGSVGRTDFPGGNTKVLMESLQQLKALPPETIVVPGHGSETTIGDELKNNPFLQ